MRQSFVRVVVMVAAATLTAGLAAGCTSNKDKGGGASTQSASDSSTLGAQDVDLTKTIGKVGKFEIPGSPGDTVEVGVLGLKVDGKVQVLSLVLTPHLTSQSQDSSVYLSGIFGPGGFAPQLIDRKNLKIYSAVEASASSALYSIKTGNDQPLYAYAVFASPEDKNMEFDLRLIDAWPPMKVKAEQ